MRRLTLVIVSICVAGCHVMPQMAHQPTLHNPFPQLSKVAVAPFFNLSNEPTLDGRRVAIAYYNELQSIPGFEAVPVGVVEAAMRQHGISLRGPDDARRLAQLLNVDAIVIGAVTDYSPYYPPRLALQVEWYAANPCFHPIPPGYGLPWGTPEEQDIPGPLVFEAEMALARQQLATQTPAFAPEPVVPQQGAAAADAAGDKAAASTPGREPLSQPEVSGPQPPKQWLQRSEPGVVEPLGCRQLVYQRAAANNERGATAADQWDDPPFGFPPDWPDPRGFVPPPPRVAPPKCRPSGQPVLRHTRTYNGHDGDFATALSSYYSFRSDARFGGWQAYLQRSEDFIRFCCHMHLAEMLSARGGAGESRIVWRWPAIR